jgi:5-hydroxyisourate hydrolase
MSPGAPARSPITTHVLDTARGQPAAGVPIALAVQERTATAVTYRPLGQGLTDADGRLGTLLAPGTALPPGVYRLTFDTDAYFRALGSAGFYPEVAVIFQLTAPAEHYHVPLLLSPFGYSTYRGS